MSTTNKIVIIILNYKSFETTCVCVDQLLKIGVTHQIIIVDNYSLDHSVEQLTERYRIYNNIAVIETSKNGGYSYGNNFGILYATSLSSFQYICIMNPDVLIEDNFFDDLCRILSQKKEYAIISPLMIYPNHLNLASIGWDIRTAKEVYQNHFLLKRRKQKIKQLYKYVGNGLVESDAVPGSFFIIDAQIFKQINYFDENIFLYNEENILGLKLALLQKKCLISLKHHFIHNHIYENDPRKTADLYKTQFKQIKRNYLITYESRKYMCTHYYGGKYSIRLAFVNQINLLLLYLKHFYYKFID